jgi:lysozyme
MTTPQLVSDLCRDEGYEAHAYTDSLGNLTIGVGHLLPKGTPFNTTWSDDQIEEALTDDIAKAESCLDASLPWWRDLDDVRQDVMVEMCFNLGIGGLLGFSFMLAQLKRGQYADAASAMLNSKWAKQVGQRAMRLADMMRTGERSA